MKLRLLAGMCLASVFAWPTVAAEFQFGPSIEYNVGAGELTKLRAGDVTGDGLDDVLVVTAGTSIQLHIFRQDANASLLTPLVYTRGINDLILSDVDGDGILEIVTCGGEGVLFWKYVGGTFVPGTAHGGPCNYLAAGDLNHDGRQDFVSTKNDLSDPTLLYGDGHGGIASTSTIHPGLGGTTTVALGDLTGDGFADFILFDLSSWRLVVYQNNQHGGFGTKLLDSGAGVVGTVYVQGVAVDDFNGDRRNDLALSDMKNSPNGSIWLYTQTASGALNQAPTRLVSYDLPQELIAADLDHDGRADLLVEHDGWKALGRYMGSSSGVGTELLSDGGYGQGDTLAVGDLNDDGCADAVNSNFNLTFDVFFGQNCKRRRASNDFNGDGYSDILWRNASTGADAIWLTAKNVTLQATTGVTDTAWGIAGSGDFNGDGKADILWRNASTGADAIWLSGKSATPQPTTAVTSLAWKIVGIGDFNGDGKADILWRNGSTGANVIWRSGYSATQQAVTAVTGLGWSVGGVGDVNGDGKSDILWRNSSSGADIVWYAGNSSTQKTLGSMVDPAWRIAGTGDFDGDGKDDLLWRNSASGSNVIWRSADAQSPQAVAAVATTVNVAAIGDYNGDRKADILWRNGGTGADVIWRAAKSALPLTVAPVSDVAWKVIP